MSEEENNTLQFLEGRLRSNPDSVLFARLADQYLKISRPKEALELCETGVKIHPFYVSGHFVLGKTYLANKMYEQAEKEFKRVLLFDPKYLAAHKYYGDLMQKIGWENSCEVSYKKILEIDPLESSIKIETAETSTAQAAAENEFESVQKVPVPESNVQNESMEADLWPLLPENEKETLDADSWPAFLEDNDAQTDVKQDNFLFDLSEPLPAQTEKSDNGEELNEQIPEPEKDIFETPTFSETPEPKQQFTDFEQSEPIEKELPEVPGIGGSLESELNLDLIEPLPVSAEEEDLMFQVPDTEKPDSSPRQPEPEIDDKKAEEFSYILDDIFKDDGEDSDEPNETSPRIVDVGEDPDLLSNMHLPEPDISDLAPPEEDPFKSPSNPVSRRPVDDNLQSASKKESGSFFSNPPIFKPPIPDLSTKEQRRKVKKGSASSEKIVTPTLGEIYAAQGQYMKAIDVFETLLKKHPDDRFYSDKIATLKQKLAEADNTT